MTLTGKASIAGINGTVAWTGVASLAAGNHLLQSAKMQDQFDLNELRDQVGEPAGLAKTNHRQEITIDFVPVAVSGTNTIANAKVGLQLPPPLAQVTLASFDEPAGATGFNTINGVWAYVGGGEIGLTNEGYAKMTLPLRRYETDITAAVS